MQLTAMRVSQCRVCNSGTAILAGMCKKCWKFFTRRDVKRFDDYLDDWYNSGR